MNGKQISVILVMLVIVLLAGGCKNQTLSMRSSVSSSATPLQILMQGNQRFVSGRIDFTDALPARRAELIESQHPVAAIVCCSDSRVPPTLIFNQGLGRIFVVRLAGDVVDRAAAGSVEYAVEHLHVHLVMVLGHDDCGAVKAAMKPGNHSPELSAVVDAIRPALKESSGIPDNTLSNVIDENTHLQAARLRHLPAMAKYIATGHLKIITARYDLATGQVV